MKNIRIMGVGLVFAMALVTLRADAALTLPALEGATISIDKNLYEIGDSPILSFENAIPGSVAVLFYSFEPDPLDTAHGPPKVLGVVPESGQLYFYKQPVTCESNEKYIQGALFDKRTRELLCVTNQVYFAVDYSGCDPDEEEEDEGEEGCTPGFWRQAHHFDCYPDAYPPETLFGDVFEDAFPGLTLPEVTRLKGGGLNALGRHTAAALLNAASTEVDYGMSAEDVISAFNGVYPGSKKDYNALKDSFVYLNEKGCPCN